MSLVYVYLYLSNTEVSFRKKVEEIIREVEKGTFTLEEFFNSKEGCYYLLTEMGGYLQDWGKLEKELKELRISEELIEKFHKWYKSFNELNSLVKRLVHDEILKIEVVDLILRPFYEHTFGIIPSFEVPVAGISCKRFVLIYYNPLVIEKVIERDRQLAREAYNKLKMDEKKWNRVVEDIQGASTPSVELSLNVEQGFPFIVLHELLHYAYGHFSRPSTEYLWEEFRSRYNGGVKEAIMNVIYDLEINSLYLKDVVLTSESYYRALGVEEIRENIGGKEVVVRCRGIVLKPEVVEEVIGATLVRAGVGDFKHISPMKPALSIIREDDLSFLVKKDPMQYYNFEGGLGSEGEDVGEQRSGGEERREERGSKRGLGKDGVSGESENRKGEDIEEEEGGRRRSGRSERRKERSSKGELGEEGVSSESEKGKEEDIEGEEGGGKRGGGKERKEENIEGKQGKEGETGGSEEWVRRKLKEAQECGKEKWRNSEVLLTCILKEFLV